MKKILFFDKLDCHSFIVALFLRPFFNSICFRNAIPFFQNLKVQKYLNIMSIKWVSFCNLNYKIMGSSFKFKPIIEKKYINNQVSNNSFVKNFINEFRLKDKQIKKLYLCFRSAFMYDGTGFAEESYLVLIKHFFPEEKFKVYFVPYQPLSYLLLKEANKENITILGFHAFTNLIIIFLKIFFKFVLVFFKSKIYNYKNKINNENFFSNNISSYKIGFFPHKNLKYADFFKKTYLYESNSSSPFFKEKVLTLFWENTDQVSKRYFRKYKIPYLNVKNLIKKKHVIIETLKYSFRLISIKNLYIFSSFQNLFFFYSFLIFRTRFIMSLNILDQLNGLKVIYVHYDTLFPQYFLLACDLKKITTISSQERPIHYISFSPLIYNKYLTAGQGFQEILKQRGYLCDQFVNIGLPRSNLIKNTDDILKIKLEKYKLIRKTKKIALFLGLKYSSDFEIGMTGQDGTSMQNNIDFVKCALHMAKNFKNLYFIIRFKDTKTINLMPKKILLEVKSEDNIEINNNLKSFDTYEFLSISDLVIGKYSSIMDEAMLVGKKIIFYDKENYLSSHGYIMNEANVIETRFEDVKNRIKNILDGRYDTSNQIKNFVSKYYYKHPSKNGFKLIKEQISESL